MIELPLGLFGMALAAAVLPEGGDMQSLAGHFFTEAEQKEIRQTVQEAEAETAAEIVVMVVSSSHDYPEARLTASFLLVLPFVLFVWEFITSFYWWTNGLSWLFWLCFSSFFLLSYLAIPHFPAVFRHFISPRRAQKEVEREAVLNFYGHSLHHTKGAIGVLIFFSVLERRVWILGDRGINRVLHQERWQEWVGELIKGIRQNKQGQVLCQVIKEIGASLENSLPPIADDINELQDLIIVSSAEANTSRGLIIR